MTVRWNFPHYKWEICRTLWAIMRRNSSPKKFQSTTVAYRQEFMMMYRCIDILSTALLTTNKNVLPHAVLFYTFIMGKKWLYFHLPLCELIFIPGCSVSSQLHCHVWMFPCFIRYCAFAFIVRVLSPLDANMDPGIDVANTIRTTASPTVLK